MNIALVQGINSGTWGYCPWESLPYLGRAMIYDDPDDPSPYATAEEAEAAARRDPSIGQDAAFIIVHSAEFVAPDDGGR